MTTASASLALVADRMATIRGILFDKDGTLIDYQASWAPVNEACARHASGGDPDLAARLLLAGGLDPETGRYRAGSPFAAGTAAEIAEALHEAGALGGVADLTLAFDDIFRAHATKIVPVTDLAALFATLAGRGLKLGIASSDNEGSIRLLAAAQRIDVHLDFVAGYDTGHGVKPGPGMALAFAAATGLDPHEIAVVGDNLHDLLMGRAAGAGLVIGVLTGTSPREVLAAEADVVLESVAELAFGSA